MAWTAPKTYNVGDVLTASEMNTYQRDNLLALVGANPIIVPSCRAYNDAAIAIPNNSSTALTFNSERWDTDTIHDTSTNPGRLTCTTAGIYHIYGHLDIAGDATGYRSATIRLNGTTIIAAVTLDANGTDPVRISISTEYSLAATNYLEISLYQNSGGDLNVNATANYSPEFGMTYLGKAA